MWYWSIPQDFEKQPFLSTEYELSVQGSSSLANESSLALSETEVENGTGGDLEKKDLEPIPEGGGPPKDSGNKGEVIANPSNTTKEGSEEGEEKEEITQM